MTPCDELAALGAFYNIDVTSTIAAHAAALDRYAEWVLGHDDLALVTLGSADALCSLPSVAPIAAARLRAAVAQWPGASLFWASPPDEKQGRFAVYSIPQNCGIQYLAGYEGPNAQADDNADYGNLSGTPAGAANHGFPTHWHHNSRAAWDLFLATVKTVQPFGESTAA